MDRSPRTRRLSVLLGVLLVTACSDVEPIGVHVVLGADGAGSVTCRSLSVLDAPGPMEAGSEGVEWQDRARLSASHGAFKKIDALRLADIEWSRTGEHGLRLRLPRGPAARWPLLLAPEPDQRPRVVKAIEPARPTSSVGEAIRFEIELPGDVTAVGHSPAIRLVRSDKDGTKAIVTVPVAAAREAGPALVVDVAWR